MTEVGRTGRTIVLSDAHGYPQMIAGALGHSGFEAGVDRLIFAGDFLDRGRCPEECLRLLEEAGAEMLWGNHEVAVLLRQPLFPQDAASLRFRERLMRRFETDAWQLVACADGVLVSHAGISADYALDFERVGFSPEALTAWINEEFREAVRRELADPWATEPWGVLGEVGPLWLRPDRKGAQGILPGVTQVAGHTPLNGRVVRELRDAGLHLVDAGAALAWGTSELLPCRYAVISAGAVAVLQRDCAPGLAA